MGAGNVGKHLPGLVEAVRNTGRRVLWVCDPMHGNTESTPQGYKTRRFDKSAAELEESFAVHEERGGHLGGVHFEMTGEDVTECVGGARGLSDDGLGAAYRSQVDPRLNYEQALELALAIARRAGAERAANGRS